MHHARHIDHPGEAIRKRDPKPKARQGFNLGYTPGRPWCDILG
jgi:hypothetical protein